MGDLIIIILGGLFCVSIGIAIDGGGMMTDGENVKRSVARRGGILSPQFPSGNSGKDENSARYLWFHWNLTLDRYNRGR